MRTDCPPSPGTKHRPARRTSGDRLRDAIMALGQFHGQVLHHSERAWSSITFSGARHNLVLLFAGDAAVAAGEVLIAELSDHEFAIPGQIVADANVVEADQRMIPVPRLVVTCELLLLEDV